MLQRLKSSWPALAIIALVAFALYMTITSVGEMFQLSTLATDFALEIREGRHEAAYARTSDAYRATTTLAQFRSAVSTSPYWRGATSVSFNTLETNGGATRASGLLKSSVGDVLADFDFTEKGEHYTIAGVSLAGAPQLVAPAPH